MSLFIISIIKIAKCDVVIHRGGLFAGKVTSLDDPNAAGGRFDAGGSAMGTMYRARYLKDGYFEALEHLKSIAVRFSLIPPSG